MGSLLTAQCGESVETRVELPPEELRQLDFDGFLGWVSDVLGIARIAEPEDRIESLTGGDDIRLLEMASAFDDLTGSGTPALAEFYGARTVRDLYLHYMHVLSLPTEAP